MARHRVPRRRDRHCGRRIPLLPRVRRGRRGQDARGSTRRAAARRGPSGPARRRARDRLRPSQGGRPERVRPLRHAHARARRPVVRLDLAAVLPARHARGDPLSGQDAVLRQDQRRLLVLRPSGLAADRSGVDRRADQLPHDRELPGLPADRRSARGRVDRRRPSLLQRPRRTFRLCADQPAPRLPAAHRAAGARLRPFSPHRLGPLPRRTPAAVREGVQEPDPGELRAARAAEGRQRGHAQRRGRTGRRRRRQRRHGPLVRALRLRPAEGPRLPDADRGARGLHRSDHRLGEHHQGREQLHASGCRVVREGDRGRARREGEEPDSRSARDHDHRAERERSLGLGVDGRIPARPALVPGAHTAERFAGECAVLRLLPDEGLLRRVAAGRPGGRQEGREPLRARPSSSSSRGRSRSSRTERC